MNFAYYENGKTNKFNKYVQNDYDFSFFSFLSHI